MKNTKLTRSQILQYDNDFMIKCNYKKDEQ